MAVTAPSPRVQAAVLLVLALPQLYLLPRSSIDVALTTFATLLMLGGTLLGLLRAPHRPFPDLLLFGVLGALLAFRVLALAWSPEPRAGMQSVVLLVQFVVALVVLAAARRTEPKLLTYVQRLYWPWVVAEVVLVVLFRLLPGVEDAFLHSVGGFFAGQNTIVALFSTSPNNVLDPAKAGGVFTNANVAAMFLGVNGMAAVAVSAVTRTRWVLWVGVAALVGVLFTGSKSAIVLAFAMPLAAVAAYYLFGSAMPARRRYQLIAALAGCALLLLLVLAVSAGLRDAMVEAFVGRTAIWGFGGQSFLHKPFLGLGFGGWDAGFPAYARAHGLYRNFPPHNMLLGAWATTGIPGLLLTLAFFVLVFRYVARGLSRRSATDKRFVAFAGAALAWVFLQGMGENTDVFGDIHMIPVVALLLVFLICPIGEESTGDDTEADRRNSATPAVPAVRDVHPQPSDVTVVLPAVVRGKGQGSDHAGDRRR